MVADGGSFPSRSPLNRPCALPIYGSVVEARLKDLQSFRYPPSAGSLEPYLAPYGYLAVNETESGDAFGQECGPKVTIKGKSKKTGQRLPGP